jgi:hypothetical protein
MKVSAHYYQLKNFLSQLPQASERYTLDPTFAQDYNGMIDRLSEDITQNLDSYKVTTTYEYGESNIKTSILRTKIGSIMGFLEGEFDLLPQQTVSSGANPTVSVINNNTIAITINQSLQQLIENAESEESKEQLTDLSEELNKSNKDWGKIKTILAWALNFSEKLFFQLLPIILKHYGYIG